MENRLIANFAAISFHKFASLEEARKFHSEKLSSLDRAMSVILKIDPSKKDIIISNNHNGITINNNNVSKRELQCDRVN